MGEIPVEIDPSDFQNTTLYIEPVEDPGHGFVAIVKTPCLPVGEGSGAVTIVSRFSSPDENFGAKEIPDSFVVPYDVFVRGGESDGLRYPGILREAALRNGSPG